MTKLINKKIHAFSIAEAVLAIFVTVLCVNLLVGILANIKKADQRLEPINNVAMAYVQLERFLKEKGPFEVDQNKSRSSQIVVKQRVGQKDGEPVYGDSYYLERYKSMVRMRKYNAGSGGHMPLILNTTLVSFSHGEDYFKIHFTETDKRKSILTFKTAKPLPKKDKKSKDDKKDAKNKDQEHTDKAKEEKKSISEKQKPKEKAES